MLKRQQKIKLNKIQQQIIVDALLIENACLKEQIQQLVLHNYFLQTVDNKDRHKYGAV